jgi:hypothetical protein
MPKKSITESRIVGFIESMECRPVAKIPEGLEWTYEIKLDGYRLEVVRAGGKTTLYSRRQNTLPIPRKPWMAVLCETSLSGRKSHIPQGPPGQLVCPPLGVNETSP